MKKLLFINLMLCSSLSYGQKTFSASGSFPVNLDGAVASCAAPGTLPPNVFNVTVSGVGTMSTTNRLLLASIALSDCKTGSKNLNLVQIRVMSPSGQCFGIYSGGLSTVGTGTHYLNLVSSTSCLNNPNTTNDNLSGSPFTDKGNNGYFNAQFNGVATNYANFTGTADGTWKVIFSENTTSAPCVESIKLTFGDPTVINQGTTGDNCINPIVWDGKSPICGNTTSMTGSLQMPGSLGGPNSNSFGTIGGKTCGWNFANNNDVWIKHVAIDNYTCLSISGISGSNISLQSIVVTDANVDGDNNPCTQVAKTSTNDPNWIISSCPRNKIYGTTAGSQKNQQHCFTSEIGKTYYLIVDGDGGANSKFWIWGQYYSFVLDLKPVENIKVTPTKMNTSVVVRNNVVITQMNDDARYNQTISIFDASGRLIFNQLYNVKQQSKVDVTEHLSPGINFIKVEIDNKTYDKFVFKIVK